MDITRYHYALNQLPLCLENHPSQLAITLVQHQGPSARKSAFRNIPES